MTNQQKAESLKNKINGTTICWVTSGTKTQTTTDSLNHLVDTDSWASKSWFKRFEKSGIAATAIKVKGMSNLIQIFYL